MTMLGNKNHKRKQTTNKKNNHDNTSSQADDKQQQQQDSINIPNNDQKTIVGNESPDQQRLLATPIDNALSSVTASDLPPQHPKPYHDGPGQGKRKGIVKWSKITNGGISSS